jgi:GT2 family glycosyltransferase
LLGTQKDITVIIPTCNGGHIFSDCLEMIGRQAYDAQLQLIVVDSGSTDGTIEAAKRAGALVRSIDKSRFHHAQTRNMAVTLAGFDRIIFMVQDAIPASDGWLSGMARGLDEDGLAAAFAAQVPHVDASPYARFETESVAAARLASAGKGLQSIEAFNEMPYDQAYRSVGLDNVCAIYRKELLEKTPFPDVDFAEDMAWAVKVAFQGYRVLYLPHVQVRHSHSRSPDYAFRRQIVNSYWVARVMGRVREDISYLSFKDLFSVTESVRSFLFRLIKDRCSAEDIKEGLFVDRLLDRFPLTRRLRSVGIYPLFLKCFRVSKNLGMPSSEATRIAQQANADMAYQMELIENRYTPRDGNEWFQTLEQVAANSLGRIYGEVYASCVLKGPAPQRLERFIRPFLSGV